MKKRIRRAHHWVKRQKVGTLVFAAAFLWGVVVGGGAVLLLIRESNLRGRAVQGSQSFRQLSDETADWERLSISIPEEDDMVGDIFEISGKAWGWFEGTIPVRVYDDNNILLYNQLITLESDNYDGPAQFSYNVVLTEAPTIGTGRIEFTDYSQMDGSVTYKKVIDVRFSFFQG